MDLLTAKEKARLTLDIQAMINDPQYRTAITYHSLGSFTVDEEGEETETSGADVESIYAARVDPKTTEEMTNRVGHVSDILLVMASDLSAVTPKDGDYITISSVKKYVKEWKLNPTGIYYRFLVGNMGS